MKIILMYVALICCCGFLWAADDEKPADMRERALVKLANLRRKMSDDASPNTKGKNSALYRKTTSPQDLIDLVQLTEEWKFTEEEIKTKISQIEAGQPKRSANVAKSEVDITTERREVLTRLLRLEAIVLLLSQDTKLQNEVPQYQKQIDALKDQHHITDDELNEFRKHPNG